MPKHSHHTAAPAEQARPHWARVFGWIHVAACGLALLTSLAVGSRAEAYDVSLTWRGVAGATNYKIHTRVNGQFIVQTVSAANTSGHLISFVVRGLPLGPTSYFTITALNSEGGESRHSNQRFVSYPMVAQMIDSDGDGLTDAEEDTNLNGYVDGDETDPQAADTDGDGWDDGYERAVSGTDPLQSDSDGDGILDAVDSCHDVDGDGFGSNDIFGSICPQDNCLYAFNPDQIDTDADGHGEACDACTNIDGERDMFYRHKATFNKIRDSKPNNDRFAIKADFALPRADDFIYLDPPTDGARVVVQSSDRIDRVDISAPAEIHTGAQYTRGWRYRGSTRSWKYVDRTPTPLNGLRKLIIKDKGRRSPGQVRIVARGRNGHYPVRSTDLPVHTSVVVGGSEISPNGACGESTYTPSDCGFSRRGNKLRCIRKD